MRGGFVEGWSNQINQYSDKGPSEWKGFFLVSVPLSGNLAESHAGVSQRGGSGADDRG